MSDLIFRTPSYGESFVLMEDNTIVGVKNEYYPENPVDAGCCAGAFGVGDTLQEAYKDAWEKMSDETKEAVRTRVAQFLMDNMKVEEGVVTEGFGVMNISVDEREAPVATFPGVKGMEEMVLDLEEDYNDIVVDKNKSYLLELMERVTGGPFRDKKTDEYSPEKFLSFCLNNGINISDIVLLDEVWFDGSKSVLFIEPEEFEMFGHCELSEAPAYLKSSVLSKSVDMINAYDSGSVYEYTVYDAQGNELDGPNGGYYGDDAIVDFIENDNTPIANLGEHEDINRCIEANSREYYLLKNKDILEVHQEEYTSFDDLKNYDDFSGYASDFDDMLDQISSDIYEAISDRAIDHYIKENGDNFRVENADIPGASNVWNLYNKKTGACLFNDNVYTNDEDSFRDVVAAYFAQEKAQTSLSKKVWGYSKHYDDFEKLLEYCEEQGVDISDLLEYREVDGHIAFATRDMVNGAGGEITNMIDLAEHTLEVFFEEGTYYARTYDMSGIETDCGCGFFIGKDIKTNGIEDNFGQIDKKLGKYISIEACLEDNSNELRSITKGTQSHDER